MLLHTTNIAVLSGTGELTDELIPLLSDNQIEYWFTDIGPSFLANYRRKQHGQVSGNLHFKVLDITKPFAEQGFDDQSFDLVIGANVMQATSDMQSVMKGCGGAGPSVMVCSNLLLACWGLLGVMGSAGAGRRGVADRKSVV